MDANTENLLIFTIEKQRFALNIDAIDRIIRSVAITRLTDLPQFVEGVIDYYGEIIAVINLRKRLGYPVETLKLSDRFIIVKTGNRKVALIVDDIDKLLKPDTKDIYNAKDLDAGMQFRKAIREDDGIIFIYDLECLLNQIQEIELEKIINSGYSSDENI